jgi:signal transduction histidine kinase
VSILNIIPILSGITALFLGLIVFTSRARFIEKFSFVLFTVAMAVWSIFVGLFLLTNNNVLAFIFAIIYYVAALLLIYGLLVFSYEFSRGRSLKGKNFTFFSVLTFIPIGIMIVITTIPHLLIQTINLGNHHVVSLNQLLYAIYCVLYVLYGFFTFHYLLKEQISHISSKKRLQQTIVVWLIGLCLPIAAYFNLILPLFGNYTLIVIGPMLTLVVVIVFFYAIMRQNLFDIRLAVVRTVAYVLALISLSVMYYFLAFFASSIFFRSKTTSFSVSPISIILALILAFIFQPIKRFFDKITNFLFYRDQYNTEDFFARLTKKLSSITDLMTLLTYASTEISKTMNASFGAFLVYREDGAYVYVSDDRRKTFPHQDMSELNGYVKSTNSDVILTGYLDDTNTSLHRMLLSHKIALVLPITQVGQIIGYLFLGEHQSAHYSARDVRALQTIADELTIAIQNALSLQAVKDINATLEQRIEVATKELRRTNGQLQRLDEAKDEFMSMASHQLRTPLTSVKGFISMVLEGDGGKVTPSQKNLLNEAYRSSERMVRLINDFLNVSRLQTGKFVIDRSYINLPQIVKEEILSIESTAAARGISFVYTMPKKFPAKLYMDEGKIRQVIMNYSDNAIFYSKEGTKIKIELSATDKDVIFTVKDTGIGVPKDEQAHLFVKFFRASNAQKQRPDGTGVGLFLAKKVMTAHGGDVIFESHVGKGSMFGFRIPLSKLTATSDVH